MTDPWFSAAQRHDEQWVSLVEQLDAALEAAVAEVLAKLWRLVLGERVAVTAAVDQPPALEGAEHAARETWQQALERWVRPILFAHYQRQYDAAATSPADHAAGAPTRAREAWWADTLHRMLPTADRVVQAVRDEIAANPADGVPELRDRVARVLGLDAPTRQLRDEIAGVEAKLAKLTALSASKRGELLNRRVGLQAELFRLRASRARSAAYNALADTDADNADQFRSLARQASRSAGDLARLERDLARVDDQLLSNKRPPSSEAALEEADLLERRSRLQKAARDSEDTWSNTATRIARTESTNVLNDATLQRGIAAETDAGEPMVKVWISAKDETVRPTHAPITGAHGQTVGIREKFQVGVGHMERPGDPLGPVEEVVNCRCSIVVLTEGEHKEIAAVLAAASPQEETVTSTTLEEGPALEDLPALMWHAVSTVEDVFTGDRRKFTAGSLRTQPLPYPMRWQREDWGGHTGAVVVANVEAARRAGKQIRTWGTFADGESTPEVDEVEGLIATRMMRGISVDGDDILDSQFSLEVDDQGNTFEVYSSARLRSQTLVAIPAYDEAQIWLGPPPESWLTDGEPLEVSQNDPETSALDLEDLDALVADISGIPEQLARYWTHGEGAAKIRWGSPGDFNRCRRQLAKYVGPGQLSGLCANLHHMAIGKWPGQESAGHALVAALEGVSFTAEQFARRDLPGPTPMVIEDDGTVYGHIAAWNTCHTGYSDVCVTPPHSPSNYALFHTGAVRLDDGTDLPIGKLTVSSGHANTKWGLRRSVEHYDNSATATAVVRAYEDEHGIQVVGRIIPGTTDDKIAELRRSPISGDWRPVGNDLELVAALGVNAPGFAVPRPQVGIVDGRQMSLVAAGVLPPRAVDDDGAYVDQLAVLAGVDPASKAEALAASLPPMTGQEMQVRATALEALINPIEQEA